MTTAAGGPGSSLTSPSSFADLSAAGAELLSDDALQRLGVALPTHCCGCGIRLQRREATSPG